MTKIKEALFRDPRLLETACPFCRARRGRSCRTFDVVRGTFDVKGFHKARISAYVKSRVKLMYHVKELKAQGFY
jgi:hypothetical protein